MFKKCLQVKILLSFRVNHCGDKFNLVLYLDRKIRGTENTLLLIYINFVQYLSQKMYVGGACIYIIINTTKYI